ncbi:MAG: hypothetical protein ACJ741_12400 [Pyrinomonadaceae bacterium]
MIQPGAQTGARRDGRADAATLVIYALATWLTDAYFMGDTPGYVTAIRAYEHGGSYIWDNPFWEFGHLLWRPAGYVALHLLRPLTSLSVGADERLQVTLALMWVNWIAGLACLLLLRRLLARVSRRAFVVALATITFGASHAFLDYAQTGCAYVPGLALLLLGMYLITRDTADKVGAARNAINALGAGASLAGAVCVWFPYVLVVPAALATPLFLSGGGNRSPIRNALKATLACALVGAVAYGAVLAHLGIHDAARLKEWMAAAGHGYNRTGFTRMVFGLARSFIYMGQDGILFKRYLLHDPYSPVSIRQLLGASLWQLAVFYITAAALVLRLIRSRAGRRTLVWLALACVPVFVFALFIFEGGMPERYLPLFPFVFVALARALDTEGDGRARAPFFKYVAFCFAAVVVVSNVRAMSKPTLRRKQDAVAARLADLPARLKPHSLIATVHLQDELSEFYFNYPFHPVNRRGQLEVYNVLEPGAARIATWREDFARKVQATWAAGGDVWLSRRFMASRPLPEWNWVEGDERRVAWGDLPNFFSGFDAGESVGGEDGFVLMARTPRNEALINDVAAGAIIDDFKR